MKLDNCGSKMSNSGQDLMEHWKRDVSTNYPDLDKAVYIVPPVTFYRPSSTTETIGRIPIEIYTPSKQLSDIRENEAENRVMRALREILREKDIGPVVAVQNVVFDNYLNFSGRLPGMKSTVDTNGYTTDEPMDMSDSESSESLSVLPEGFVQKDYGLFPRPRDLSTELQRGSFDLLIIHSRGILICEIKTIGDTFWSTAGGMSTQAERESTIKRISKAVKQLGKEEIVLRHLVSDIDLHDLQIKKTLLLPNMKKEVLQRVLSTDAKLREEFCKCLQTDSLEEALDLCIFSHHLPPVGRALETDETVRNGLKTWWKRLVARGGSEIPKDVFTALVARFCGPATSLHVPTLSGARADVRTLHNAVYETWKCMKTPVLYQEESQFLRTKEKRAFLTGPPGTGKTTVLIHKGAQWASDGLTVYVVSLWTASEAVSYAIQQQMQDRLPQQKHKDRVKLLISRRRKFKDVLDELEKDLTEDTKKGLVNHECLHILMDEVPWFFNDFVQALDRLMATEYVLWAASVFYGFRPNSFREMKLTRSVRCPPVVIREIQRGPAYAARAMHHYPDLDAAVLSSQPPPTDGPPVKRVGHGLSHPETDIWDCAVCGLEVATFLRRDLQIGPKKSQSRLTFSDVLVSGYVHCNTPSSGFLEGLESGEIPFQVIRKEDINYTQKLAFPENDSVQVAEPECLIGLERPVVVVIGTNDLIATCPRFVDPWCDVIASCLSQLVVVEDMKDPT